jgi:hypothetical protein
MIKFTSDGQLLLLVAGISFTTDISLKPIVTRVDVDSLLGFDTYISQLYF